MSEHVNDRVVVLSQGTAIYGELIEKPPGTGAVYLENARAATIGDIGLSLAMILASEGPHKRHIGVTPVVPFASLGDIHAIIRCTPEAIKEWERKP